MDKKQVNAAQTFEELATIGIEMLREMAKSGKPIVEICGPVSTGGLGSVEKNLARLEKAVNVAKSHGLQTFDQTPFEEAMKRLSKKYPLVEGYPVAILDLFYKKIFETGLIKKFLFLPDWQSSRGATWERNIAKELHIAVEEYPKEWLSEIK